MHPLLLTINVINGAWLGWGHDCVCVLTRNYTENRTMKLVFWSIIYLKLFKLLPQSDTGFYPLRNTVHTRKCINNRLPQQYTAIHLILHNCQVRAASSRSSWSPLWSDLGGGGRSRSGAYPDRFHPFLMFHVRMETFKVCVSGSHCQGLLKRKSLQLLIHLLSF